MLPISSLYSPANWSQFFPKSVLPTTFLPLTSPIISFFLQDSVSIPPAWSDFTNTTCYVPSPTPNGLPTPVPDHKHHDILQLIVNIRQVALEFSTGLYPKIEHISPSDCLWLMPDHTIRCVTKEDVLLLCTGSTKVLEFLKQRIQLDTAAAAAAATTTSHSSSNTITISGNITNQSPNPFSLYPTNTSEKDTTVIPNISKTQEKYQPIFYHNQSFLSLRKWFNTIHPSESFRVMIYNNHIFTISQRDGLKYEWERTKLEQILYLIIKFTHDTIIPTWQSYIKFVLEHIDTITSVPNVSSDFDLENVVNLGSDKDFDRLKSLHFNPQSINLIFDVYINTKNNSIRILDITPLLDSILMNNGLGNDVDDEDDDDRNPLDQLVNKNIDDTSSLGNSLTSQNIENPSLMTQIAIKSLKLYQTEPILFSRQALTSLSIIHKIQPYALNLLSTNINTHSNSDSNDNKQGITSTDLSFFTQTRINNIPLSIHLCQLLSNLVASKYHFFTPHLAVQQQQQQQQQQHQDSSQISTTSTITHPLYSYLMPTTLPQIPSDQCLGLNFQYHYTPHQIPHSLEQLWQLFSNSLSTQISNLIFQPSPETSIVSTGSDTHYGALTTTQISQTTPKLNPNLIFFPRKPTTYLFPNPQQAKSDQTQNKKSTGPYLDSVITPQDQGPNDNDIFNQSNTSLSQPEPHSTLFSSNLIDYTDALPQCGDLIGTLLQTKEGTEVIGYGLLLLQYIFHTQYVLNLNITPDFLLNETLQTIAHVKTDIVNAYYDNGIVINGDGFVKPIGKMLHRKREVLENAQNEQIDKSSDFMDFDETLVPQKDNMDKNQIKITAYNNYDIITTLFPPTPTALPRSSPSQFQPLTSTSANTNTNTNTTPSQLLSPSVPHLPLLIQSQSYIPPYTYQQPYTISASTTTTSAGNGHPLPSLLNVLLPYPSYPLLTPHQPFQQQLQRQTQPGPRRNVNNVVASVEIIDPILSLIEDETEYYPFLAKAILNTTLLSTCTSTIANTNTSQPHLIPDHTTPLHYSSPIPFHIVTDYTQTQEDERVTVEKEANRLPSESNNSHNNIDVSSADGINAFIRMMMMTNGDDDSDWTDSDEDHDE